MPVTQSPTTIDLVFSQQYRFTAEMCATELGKVHVLLKP